MSSSIRDSGNATMDTAGNALAEVQPSPPYQNGQVALTLSAAPFNAFCKLDAAVDGKVDARRMGGGGGRDLPPKPLIRGRYNGLCASEPSQRQNPERFESFLCGPLDANVSSVVGGGAAGLVDCFTVSPCFLDEHPAVAGSSAAGQPAEGAAASGSGPAAATVGKGLTASREERRRQEQQQQQQRAGQPSSRATYSHEKSGASLTFHVEPFSRSSAGKVLEPDHLRTPLALEKCMHFLVQYYIRSPHTPLCFTKPFTIWGYLWDRLRSIRTTWVPQLPLCSAGFENYTDEADGRLLSPQVLESESRRRMQWLEFTVAALSVGSVYLCRTVEGCQSFVQEKKNFLESISQCFTDLTVWYRAEQRSRHAEFVSLLLLLYGLNQESKAEDRATFCPFVKLQMSDGSSVVVPEPVGRSVNLSQVYKELEKQAHLIDTQPVKAAVKLINTWAEGKWFEFFHLCRHECLTPLQRSFLFQSFTYARFRAVLDLVVPTNPVYPKLRWRNHISLKTLSGLLMMQEVRHCVSFLQTMGLSDLIDEASGTLRLSTPSSAPLVSAAEVEERCDNKAKLLLPTYTAFFGFHVWQEAFDLFPREQFCEGDRSTVEQLRFLTRRVRTAKAESLLQSGAESSDAIRNDEVLIAELERRLLQKKDCPVNLMEILEPYCPPYNHDVAALRMRDLPLDDTVVFGSLQAHREAMLLRCLRQGNPAGEALLLPLGITSGTLPTRCANVEAAAADMLDAFEEESIETQSDVFIDADQSSQCWGEDLLSHGSAGATASAVQAQEGSETATGEEEEEDGKEEGLPASIAASRALLDSLEHDDAYTRVDREMKEIADAQNREEEEKRKAKQDLLDNLTAKLRQQQQIEEQQRNKLTEEVNKEGANDEPQDDSGAGPADKTNQLRKQQPVLALPSVGPVVVTPLPSDYKPSTSHPSTPAVTTTATVETPKSTAASGAPFSSLPSSTNAIGGFPTQPSSLAQDFAPRFGPTASANAQPHQQPTFGAKKVRREEGNTEDGLEEVEDVNAVVHAPTSLSAQKSFAYSSAKPDEPLFGAKAAYISATATSAQVHDAAKDLLDRKGASPPPPPPAAAGPNGKNNASDILGRERTGKDGSSFGSPPHGTVKANAFCGTQKRLRGEADDADNSKDANDMREAESPTDTALYAEFSHIKAPRRRGAANTAAMASTSSGSGTEGGPITVKAKQTNEDPLHFASRRTAIRKAFLSRGGPLLSSVPLSAAGKTVPRAVSRLPNSIAPSLLQRAQVARPDTTAFFFSRGFASLVADFLVDAAQRVYSRARTRRALRYAMLCGEMEADGVLSCWRRGLFYGEKRAISTDTATGPSHLSGSGRFGRSTVEREHPLPRNSKFLSERENEPANTPWRGSRALQEEDAVARRMCIGFDPLVPATLDTALMGGVKHRRGSAGDSQRAKRHRGESDVNRPTMTSRPHPSRGSTERRGPQLRESLAQAWSGIERAMPFDAAEANPVNLLEQLDRTIVPALTSAPMDGGRQLSVERVLASAQRLGEAVQRDGARQMAGKSTIATVSSRPHGRDGAAFGCASSSWIGAPAAARDAASATKTSAAAKGDAVFAASFVLVSSESSTSLPPRQQSTEETTVPEWEDSVVMNYPPVALARRFRDPFELAVASLFAKAGVGNWGGQGMPNSAVGPSASPFLSSLTLLASVAEARPVLSLSTSSDGGLTDDGYSASGGSYYATSRLTAGTLGTRVSVYASSSAELSAAFAYQLRPYSPAAAAANSSKADAAPLLFAERGLCPQLTPIVCLDATPEDEGRQRKSGGRDDAGGDSFLHSSSSSRSSDDSDFFSPTRWSKFLQVIDRLVKAAVGAEAANLSLSLRAGAVPPYQAAMTGGVDGAPRTRIPGLLVLVRLYKGQTSSRRTSGALAASKKQRRDGRAQCDEGDFQQNACGEATESDEEEAPSAMTALREKVTAAVASSWRRQVEEHNSTVLDAQRKAENLSPATELAALSWRQQQRPQRSEPSGEERWTPRSLTGKLLSRHQQMGGCPSSPAPSAATATATFLLPHVCPLVLTIVPIVTERTPQTHHSNADGSSGDMRYEARAGALAGDARVMAALEHGIMEGVYALLRCYQSRIAAVVDSSSESGCTTECWNITVGGIHKEPHATLGRSAVWQHAEGRRHGEDGRRAEGNCFLTHAPPLSPLAISQVLSPDY